MPKHVLLKDLVIPAGTVFDTAPRKTIRGPDAIDCIVGLTKDTSGEFTYYLDRNDPGLSEWFGEAPE